MKSWLKYFGLSFFSDKIAKEAVRRSMLNFLLGFVLSLVFIFCGVLAANTLPFRTHYNKASQFKAFVRTAFENVNLTIKDGRASADKVVNTLPAEISAKGYKLVIDTRPSSAFDDFEAYCTPKEGDGEISYEDFLALPEEERDKYDFKIRYTPNELILTEELTATHEKYLSTVQDESVSAKYAEISGKKDSLSAEEYGESVYLLYLKAYYPDLTKYVKNSAPLLRNYYYLNYLNKAAFSEYLFVFDNALIGSFKTDGGLKTSFYGVYDGMSEKVVNGENSDGFLKQAFDKALPMMANVYAMNILRFLPFIALMPIILALAMWGVMHYLKVDVKFRRLTTCIKIEGGYLAFSSLVTALTVFVCGFFVSGSVLNYLPLILLFAILLIRTVVYIVMEKINKDKSKLKGKPIEKETEI